MRSQDRREIFLERMDGLIPWARLEARIVPAYPKGGIVDATIISAPSPTGNRSNACDPEMHRTRKGNQWHFGMKLHIGIDPRGLVHHLEGTAANAHGLTPSGRLLHGEEKVRTDAGYRGVGKRAGAGGASIPDRERAFGCDMVRHRGLERNVQRLALLPDFSNLMIAQPHLS